MATMLQDNDGLTFDKVEVGGRAFNMDSTAQLDIPRDMPGDFPLPERIVVRKLDLVAGASGPIAWVQPDLAHPCNGLADVAQMVINLRPGGVYDPREDAAAFHRPLDLNLSKPTCFIIRLSSSWTWRFSHKARGATLGPDVATDPANYCHLRHVLDDGREKYDQFDHPNNCKILYFFARPPAGASTFNNSFNLNVELLYPGGPADQINSIPIVIDPDIRFPGGSPP